MTTKTTNRDRNRRKRRSRRQAPKPSRGRVAPGNALAGRVPRNKWGVTQRDLRLSPCFCIDDLGHEITTYDQVPAALAKAGARMDEVWLWCLHCRRFFQAKDLALDFLGNWQRCPFDDCGAAGFDIDILLWSCSKDTAPTWPRSEEELRFGLETV